MLTVYMQYVEKDGGVVEERTMEASEVRRVTRYFRYRDGTEPEEGEGVHVEKEDGSTLFFGKRGLPEGMSYRFFVMNENGQTVSRYEV